jgi:hypothetical protein
MNVKHIADFRTPQPENPDICLTLQFENHKPVLIVAFNPDFRKWIRELEFNEAQDFRECLRDALDNAIRRETGQTVS